MKGETRHKPISVKYVNYVLDDAVCPKCGAISKKNTIGERAPIDVGYDYPVILSIRVSVHKCPKGCGFFRAQPPFLTRGAHYTEKAKNKCVESVLEDRVPISSVPKRVDRDFNISPAASSVYRWLKKEVAKIDLKASYEPWVVESFSGVICIDEVYDKEYAILFATDPIADITVGYQITQGCTKEDVERFVKYLQSIGIDPDVVVTDDSNLYEGSFEEVWVKAKHQQCVFHTIKDINKEIAKGVKQVKDSIKIKLKKRGDQEKLKSLK